MTTTTLTSTTEIAPDAARLELARRAVELLTTTPEARDPAVMTEVFAPDARFLGPASNACGAPDAAERTLHRAFSAVRSDILDVRVNGDGALARIAIEGRHTGTFEGCAATGDLRRADCLISLRIDRARVVEVYSLLQWAS